MTVDAMPTKTTRPAAMSQSAKPRSARFGGGSGVGAGENGGSSGSREGSGRAVFPSMTILISDLLREGLRLDERKVAMTDRTMHPETEAGRQRTLGLWRPAEAESYRAPLLQLP
jgi:hypothetical protein